MVPFGSSSRLVIDSDSSLGALRLAVTYVQSVFYLHIYVQRARFVRFLLYVLLCTCLLTGGMLLTPINAAQLTRQWYSDLSELDLAMFPGTFLES